MISLRQFMQGDIHLAESVARSLELLLQGIALHAVKANPADHETLKNELSQIGSAFATDQTASGALVAAGAANQAMQEYNRGVERRLRGITEELRSITALFTNTLESISAAGDEAIVGIRQVETKLVEVSQLEDIRILRVKLQDSLKTLESERQRQRQRSDALVEELTTQVQAVKSRAESYGAASSEDGVTGLPGRASAEAYMSEACHRSSDLFAACFVVERIEMINDRYGYAVGDQILQLFAQKMTTDLGPADRLFRWRGNAFLAVIERKGSVERVRTEVARSASAIRTEHMMTIKSRSILLPVSAAWMVIALPKGGGIDSAVKVVDDFSRTRGGARS